MTQIVFRGRPRTSQEWAALAKVAGGQSELSKDELRALFMLGLVDRALGRIILSAHGRLVLGLTANAHLETATVRPDASSKSSA